MDLLVLRNYEYILVRRKRYAKAKVRLITMPKTPAKAKKELSEIFKTMEDVWQLQGQLITSAKKKLAAIPCDGPKAGPTKRGG